MFRNGHPDPQFERENYIDLNGEWDFKVFGNNPTNFCYEGKILVPFCPESVLSGIGTKEHINDCEYSRRFSYKSIREKERVLLHFGAVDYETEVFVNGRRVGAHIGGFSSFQFDITNAVQEGENELTVRVKDYIQEKNPSGKQTKRDYSYGCFYRRCTGIWQTVWLETVAENYIRSVKYYPNIQECTVSCDVSVLGEGEAVVEVFYEGRPVGRAQRWIKGRNTLRVELSEKHLWELGQGRLYDVKITYQKDVVKSYFGLREVQYDGYKFLLNGKSVFQKLVLDQGHYPEGIYTAKDEEELVRDITLAMKLGFNGGRLHQKVFEKRYLYHCDRLGYMVWGEYPSWGIDYNTLKDYGKVAGEWTEVVERDFNHPSIVVWCPLNETWDNHDDPIMIRDVRFVKAMYQLTKSLDDTRPCVDVSGGFHGDVTDFYDFHNYDGEEAIEKWVKRLDEEGKISETTLGRVYAPDFVEESYPYIDGMPVQLSEFGGIALDFSGKNEYKEKDDRTETGADDSNWGYHADCSEERFLKRYERLIRAIYGSKKLSGSCYTQLYDVEQERNGFYDYERRPKLSKEGMEKVAQINRLVAEIEK